MEYLSVSQFSAQTGISERTVRNWCATGKIKDAYLVGKTWNIPKDASVPSRKKNDDASVSPLLGILKEQKQMRLNGSLYHFTMTGFTFNSNRIDGNRLSREQVRSIFESNVLGITDDVVRVDDILETLNHFKCIDHILDTCTEPLSERYIKQLHLMLHTGLSGSLYAGGTGAAPGKYKTSPNYILEEETCPPEQVPSEMATLLENYNARTVFDFDDVLDFHKQLESIHPFPTGNGRIGRLLMFKECLAHGFLPFIITEDLKQFYFRGLDQWNEDRSYLRDLCVMAQEWYYDFVTRLR